MSAQALINRYARAIIRGALSRQYDYSVIRQAVGIPADIGPDDDYDFDPGTLARISRQVKLLMQDEFCGLTATRCRIGAFSLMCDLIIFSDTLEQALRKAFRFYSVLTEDVQFELETAGDTARVFVRLADPAIDADHFLCEWWFLNWRAISSWLIGEEIDLVEVAFSHHPAVAFEGYAQVFSRHCRFGQPQAFFSFDRGHLTKRIIRNTDDLLVFIGNSSIDLVSIPGVEQSLKNRVKAHLQNHFFETQHFPSMEAVAVQYHMSSQTLRRHLEEEGASYRGIKEEIRRDVVMKWLGNSQISISEISRMGGFAEPNGLTRAVKSWIGLSPKAYRDGLAAQRAAPARRLSGPTERGLGGEKKACDDRIGDEKARPIR